MKHDPEELKSLRDDLENVFKGYRDLLNDEPRIARPLAEARDAARIKYENISEGRAVEKVRERVS